MLKLEQSELAELSEISLETVRRLERMDGLLAASVRTVSSIQRALEREGVILVPENGGSAGVRLRRDPPPNIRTRTRRGA